METRFSNSIDIVSEISPTDFKKEYLKKNKPVVLRGLWDDFPARKKWDVDFFKKELGEINVGVFDGKLQKEDRSFKHPDKRMKFSEYLTAITSDKDTDLRLFLFNIFRHKPNLRNDFDFPPLTKLYLKKVPFMFFGGKNSKVRLHQDMDWSNVFLTQLHGRKEVVLFHPKYSKLLYRYPFGVHSSVDIENPDYEKFPALKHVKGMRCVLEAGDTLFIPSGHWHYIKYLDGGYAINQRALNPNPIYWLKGFWHVAVLSTIDDIMRYFFGDHWFKRKSEKSKNMAEQEMAKLAIA